VNCEVPLHIHKIGFWILERSTIKVAVIQCITTPTPRNRISILGRSDDNIPHCFGGFLNFLKYYLFINIIIIILALRIVEKKDGFFLLGRTTLEIFLDPRLRFLWT
jgi:hypothetical protein